MDHTDKNTDNTRRIATPHPSMTPAQQAYFHAAIQWFHYSTWTIDEAANLLGGCLPKREMFQAGEANGKLDQAVLEIENRIRKEIGKSFEAESSKKYFAPIEIKQTALMAWAVKTLSLPPILQTAYATHQRTLESEDYSTPCLEAIQWTISEFWRGSDFRNPATEGEIIQALLQKFPGLGHEECIMVEHVCRHPVTRQTI